MKQIHYTACRSGQSVNGKSGFQVRAATPGIPPGKLSAAVALMGYALPDAWMLDDKTAAQAPVRLALIDTTECGRVLCHGVYAGRDPETQRFGNFFSHLLMDLPPTFTAAQAVAAWNSPFWRRADEEGGAELPDASAAMLSGGALPPPAAAHRQLAAFALAALLTGPPRGRIFLVAPPNDVIACIATLIALLPKERVETLTFSTYEVSPLNCPARIVATWWPRDAGADLASACYTESGAGLNTLTGRRSELPAIVTATRIVDDAIDGRAAVCADVISLFLALGSMAPSLLALTFRTIAAPSRLTAEELRLMTSHVELMRRWMACEDALPQLLRIAESTPDGASLLRSFLTAAPAGTAKKFSDLWCAAIEPAMEAGDAPRVHALLNGALPALDAELAHDALARVFAGSADPSQLLWPVRASLLAAFAVGVPHHLPTWDRWLNVIATDLASLISLNLPLPLKIRAVLQHCGGSDTGAVAAACRAEPEILLPVLQDLACDEPGERRAAAVFSALPREDVLKHLSLMMTDRSLPAALIGQCVAKAVAYDPVNALRLAQQYGSALADRCGAQQDLQATVGALLKTVGPREIRNAGVVGFFERAGEILPVESRQFCLGAGALGRFFAAPDLWGPQFNEAVQGAAVFRSAPAGAAITAEFIGTVVQAARQPNARGEFLPVRPLLDSMAPVCGDRLALFKQITRDALRDPNFPRSRALVIDLLSISLIGLLDDTAGGQPLPIPDCAEAITMHLRKQLSTQQFRSIEETLLENLMPALRLWNKITRKAPQRRKSNWRRWFLGFAVAFALGIGAGVLLLQKLRSWGL